MNYRLLIPNKEKGETKVSLAGAEARKMKALMGALRALWRSTAERGIDLRVTELKTLLQPSPTRAKAPPSEEGESEDVRNSDDDADHTGYQASEHHSDHSGNESDVSEASVPQQPEDSLVEKPASDSEDEGDEPSPVPLADQGPDEEQPLSSQESVDSLNAPTLQLGKSESEGGVSDNEDVPKATQSESESEDGSPLSSSSIDMRDSQVSSGWMGKCIMADNAVKKAREERRRQDNHVSRVVGDIIVDVDRSLPFDLMGTVAGDMYANYCRQSVERYGDGVYGSLASTEIFNHWLSQQKPEDCCSQFPAIIFFSIFVFTVKALSKKLGGL